MKKFLFLLTITLLFTTCSGDDDSSDSNQDPIDSIEIIDYELKNKTPFKIYPVRSYSIHSSGETIIIYGKYGDDTNLDKITQIVYQNNEDHLEFSFDNQSNLIAITNYDLATNTIKEKVLIKEDNSNFYLHRDNVTEQLQRGENFVIEEFTGDFLDNKIYSVLNQNALLFSYINGTDGNGILSKTLNNKKTAIIPPLVIVGIAVGAVVVKFRDVLVKAFTKKTKIESESDEELYEKICDEAAKKRGASKFSFNVNSNYLCNESQELNEAREDNSSMELCYQVNNNEIKECGEIDLSGNWYIYFPVDNACSYFSGVKFEFSNNNQITFIDEGDGHNHSTQWNDSQVNNNYNIDSEGKLTININWKESGVNVCDPDNTGNDVHAQIITETNFEATVIYDKDSGEFKGNYKFSSSSKSSSHPQCVGPDINCENTIELYKE